VKPVAIIPLYIRNKQDAQVSAYCVDSLLVTADVDILIIDDGSPSRKWSNQFHSAVKGNVETIMKHNSGFAKTVNVGLKRAHLEGRDAILVNADIYFHEEGWLEEFQKGTEFVRGARLYYPNGTIQHAGIYYSLIHRDFNHIYRFAPGNFNKALEPRICPVTGALQYITNECLDEVGYYDSKFSMSWEDVDYCLQVFNAGHKCEYMPKVEAIHHEGMFRGGSKKSEKVAEWEKNSWYYLHEKWDNVGFSEWVPNMLTDI
jgi:O-antigen biosynthesis protein